MFDILKEDVLDQILGDLDEIKTTVKEMEKAELHFNSNSKEPNYGKLLSYECLKDKLKPAYSSLPLTKGHTAIIDKGKPVVKEFQINTTDNAICVSADNQIYVLTHEDLLQLAKDNGLFKRL